VRIAVSDLLPQRSAIFAERGEVGGEVDLGY
jgi:hypothetical protein